jgi:hypothetical protein
MTRKQNQNRQRPSRRQRSGQPGSANPPRQRTQGPNQPSQSSQPSQPNPAGDDAATLASSGKGAGRSAERQARGTTRAARSEARANRAEGGGQRVNTFAQPRRAERRPEIIRQRKEERRKAYERRRRNWLFIRIGIGVVVVAVVAGIAWGAFRQFEQFQLRDDVTVYGGIDDLSRGHPDGPLQYDVIPPVGGDHNITWQNCGFYEEPIYNWHGVHSLEHGAVWVTYRPELPQDQIDTLEEKAEETYVLVSPYPGLKAPVVASVWGRQIELDGANDERLDVFIREYRRNPNTTPEQTAICTSGTSQTMAANELPQQQPLTAGTPAASPAAQPAATPAASPVAPVGSPQVSPVASPVASQREADRQG